ncbi:MAG TPA: hypothetical protein VFH72_13325 [Candidatus Baltobacteraceae bacterium]|nr:hypothetical protein [Candidatus Baltobacteraceae bacterium]
MTWIYSLPAWLFMSAAVIGACALACGLLAFMRKRMTRNEQIAHNDVAGPILTTIGTVLAVMMSFMVVGVWQEYDNAAQTAQREASALSDLYHLAIAIPQPFRSHVRGEIEQYLRLALNYEWPDMQHGGESVQANQLAYKLGEAVDSWRMSTPGEGAIKAEAMQYVRTFWDMRRDRILANSQGIPLVLWSAMLFIGTVTIVFSFYFRVDKPHAQYLMIVAETAVITIIFALIAELDYPFRGDVAIQPDAFMHVLNQIHGILPRQ